MNKNEKDFMIQLSNLDDFSVEEIAENYPALNKKAKKRILKKCIKKHSFSTESDYDGEEKNTISGTERYNRNIWYKFAASAAAFVIAVGGITGVFMLNRNLNGNDISETEMTPVISFPDQSNEGMSEKVSDTTDNKPISLSGTNWFKSEDNGPTEKEIEFNNDGVNGYYIIYPENVITTESTKIPFTYEQNGYDVTFCMGPDDTVTAKLSIDDWYVTLTIEWQDGHKECFYNYDIINTSSDNGNENDNSQIPPADKESSVNNPDNSVPKNSTPTIPTQNATSATSAQNNAPAEPEQNTTPAIPEQSNPPEVQKTYIDRLYYVEIAGVSGYCDDITRGIHGYMGFEFMMDGTLTKYFFDDTGNAIGSTIVKTNYEIVENRFSYGDKAGTIVNPNDGTSFTVQFDDGDIFNFSTQQPLFRKYYFIGTKPDTLNGTIWAKCFGDMDENYNYTDRRTIEFKEDGISGTVYVLSRPRDVTKSTITEIPFTYEQNDDEITFHMESSPYAMVKAKLTCNPYDEICGLNVEYPEADEWGNNLGCFGQTGCINDYNYNY